MLAEYNSKNLTTFTEVNSVDIINTRKPRTMEGGLFNHSNNNAAITGNFCNSCSVSNDLLRVFIHQGLQYSGTTIQRNKMLELSFAKF